VIDEGVEAMVRSLGCQAADLQAWLGPCIGPQAFEVGPDVLASFSAPEDRACFVAHPSVAGKWLADLPALARARLARLGVHRVTGGQWCTFSDEQRFFSFRRTPVTGRQAALIWAR
jgi:copper oxidase (laccase) domain-containing protein